MLDISAFINFVFEHPLILLGFIILIVAIVKGAGLIQAIIAGLFFDAIDFVLSMGDNFVFGAGVAGADVGDLIAGLIIFVFVWRAAGFGWAVLACLEAWNFFVGSIPGVGEIPEFITGSLPSVSAIFVMKRLEYQGLIGKIKEKYEQITEPFREKGLADEEQDRVDHMNKEIDRIERIAGKLNYKKAIAEAEQLLGEENKVAEEEIDAEEQGVEDELIRDLGEGDIDTNEAQRKRRMLQNAKQRAREGDINSGENEIYKVKKGLKNREREAKDRKRQEKRDNQEEQREAA